MGPTDRAFAGQATTQAVLMSDGCDRDPRGDSDEGRRICVREKFGLLDTRQCFSITDRLGRGLERDRLSKVSRQSVREEPRPVADTEVTNNREI